MKKIVSFLLLLSICFSMIIPVKAAGEMVVAGAQVSAAPGEKVAVEIRAQNNPGFAYLRIAVEYDDSVLTFEFSESESNASELVLTAGESRISWDASADYSENAVIGTLYFTVAENAAHGEYPITITCEECYNENLDDVAVSTESAVVNIEDAESTIYSAHMALGTDITVNYYALLADSHKNAQMKFTMNGRETLVNGTPTDVEGKYLFQFCGVAPQCMGDNIKAELMLGDEVLDTKAEYSVRTYCQNMLSKSASELEISEEKFAALKSLVSDLLEYGARAQIYRNYKTNALVNEGISGITEFTELTDASDKYLEESTLEGVQFVAAGVHFDYVNSLYVKFTAPEMTEDNFYILVVNDETGEEFEYTLSDCTLISEENSKYQLVLDPVFATDYDSLYYIEMYAPRSASSTRFECKQYLEYRLSSYVYSMQNREDSNGNLTPMANLARAVYNYGLSAKQYAGIAN